MSERLSAEYVFTDEERKMLLRGLGWAVSEGALASEDVVDLAVKLGSSREDWYDTYGPWDWDGEVSTNDA
jgi:hypothetical protein